MCACRVSQDTVQSSLAGSMHTLDKRGSVTPSEYGGASSFASSELAYPGKRIQRWQEVRALCPGPPQSPGSDVHSKLSANAFGAALAYAC